MVPWDLDQLPLAPRVWVLAWAHPSTCVYVSLRVHGEVWKLQQIRRKTEFVIKESTICSWDSLHMLAPSLSSNPSRSISFSISHFITVSYAPSPLSRLSLAHRELSASPTIRSMTTALPSLCHIDSNDGFSLRHFFYISVFFQHYLIFSIWKNTNKLLITIN